MTLIKSYEGTYIKNVMCAKLPFILHVRKVDLPTLENLLSKRPVYPNKAVQTP